MEKKDEKIKKKRKTILLKKKGAPYLVELLHRAERSRGVLHARRDVGNPTLTVYYTKETDEGVILCFTNCSRLKFV